MFLTVYFTTAGCPLLADCTGDTTTRYVWRCLICIQTQLSISLLLKGCYLTELSILASSKLRTGSCFCSSGDRLVQTRLIHYVHSVKLVYLRA